jgi:hypothetical protein
MEIQSSLPKNMPIENKGVRRQPEGAKKGGPKNEGISRDVYENKGQKKNGPFRFLQKLMKTKE